MQYTVMRPVSYSMRIDKGIALMSSRRQFIGMFAAVTALCCLGGVCSGEGIAFAEQARPTKLKFSETFRREQMTKHESSGFSSSTETQSAAEGKMTLEFETSLESVKTDAFDGKTVFAVKVGSFQFRAPLENDKDYRKGKTSARLTVSTPSASGNSRVTLGTAVLRWERDKFTVKIEAKTPSGGKPVAAEDFLDSMPGAINAETTARVEIGTTLFETTLALQGSLKRKTASGGNISGQVDVVDLRGQIKPSDKG